MCLRLAPSVSAEMTLPSAYRPWLIFTPSANVAPLAPVSLTRSLPALGIFLSDSCKECRFRPTSAGSGRDAAGGRGGGMELGVNRKGDKLAGQVNEVELGGDEFVELGVGRRPGPPLLAALLQPQRQHRVAAARLVVLRDRV